MKQFAISFRANTWCGSITHMKRCKHVLNQLLTRTMREKIVMIFLPQLQQARHPTLWQLTMSASRKGPFLLGRPVAGEPNPLETGACVPHTGAYRVTHQQHRLPAEVVLLQDEYFPRCEQCAEPVSFQLIRVMDHLPLDSVCKVYELPVIHGAGATDAEKAAG